LKLYSKFFILSAVTSRLIQYILAFKRADLRLTSHPKICCIISDTWLFYLGGNSSRL